MRFRQFFYLIHSIWMNLLTFTFRKPTSFCLLIMFWRFKFSTNFKKLNIFIRNAVIHWAKKFRTVWKKKWTENGFRENGTKWMFDRRIWNGSQLFYLHFMHKTHSNCYKVLTRLVLIPRLNISTACADRNVAHFQTLADHIIEWKMHSDSEYKSTWLMIKKTSK